MSAPNFDRIARVYRWGEYIALGPILQRTRTHLLADLGCPRHAFVLGDGDGRFLEQLLLRYPACNAIAVDTSAVMLRLLQQRCARSIPHAAERLETIHASALDVSVPSQIDLIVSHFLLDCFSQETVDCLVENIAAQLQPGALWLVSDFAIPSSKLLRLPGRLYIAGLYTAFRLLTGLRVNRLPEPSFSLRRSGFRRIQRQSSLGGLLYTELWLRE